jgi:hypothetical protein
MDWMKGEGYISQRDYERLMEANRRADPAFYQKLVDARQRQP